MFYTLYPIEMILEDAEEAAPPILEMSVQGRPILATQGADGGLTLERLLSTDPLDYLEPALQPGANLPR